MGKSGTYQGKHYTEYVETVRQLKRENRLDDAVTLLGHLVDATEAENRAEQMGVAPWYYEQLAIIHAKRKDSVAEVAILERFAGQRHAPGSSPAKLLARLEAARDRLSGQP